MSLSQSYLAELEHEYASSKRILERIPFNDPAYKPHEKSMSMERLARHVAELWGWAAMTINTDLLDFAAGYVPTPEVNSTEELLALHDNMYQQAKAALSGASDEEFGKMWTLRNGEHVIFTLPKGVVLRNMVFNHIIHHRGQLSVYLRLKDIAVPGLYGPSADEK
jgi:uncharacterized damage-inducible protein DinB